MKITHTINLKLEMTMKEATALKDVLGGLTDEQFRKLGVIESREALRNLYDSLPFSEEVT